MQLVLSNNRIIAHGENFLAMGGTVINTETGEKFDNCTVAECEGCPSDIDQVGYEYRAGVFVPCSPYGKGDNEGYFMEVCKRCATPRNSGLSIKDYLAATEWKTIATERMDFTAITSSVETKTIFSDVEHDELLNYTEIAIVAKSGTSIFSGSDTTGSYVFVNAGLGSSSYNIPLVDLRSGTYLTFQNDTVLFSSPIYPQIISDDSSGMYSVTTKAVMMHNGDIPALYISAVYDSGVNGTFELKARYKTDLILR